MAGITVDVWTLTKFLSKHAVRDTYGVIETPETSGLIPTTTSAIDAGPTPVPEFSPLPTPGASITLLSIFLPTGCGFCNIAGHGVECQAVAAKY